MKDKKWKIAVSSICKNEEKFIDRWFETIILADKVYLLDTGSTDKTIEKILRWQEKYPNKIILNQKIFNPWSFCVARQYNLDLISNEEQIDIIVSADIDECWDKDWYNAIQENWKDNTNSAYILHAHSVDENGNPTCLINSWKHAFKFGEYRWEGDIHEAVSYIGKGKEEIISILDKVYVVHKQDLSKPRNYLNMLKEYCLRNKKDYYRIGYLLGELEYHKEWTNIIDFSTILDLKNWNLYEDKWLVNKYFKHCLTHAYYNTNNFLECIRQAEDNLKEDSTFRLYYWDLGQIYYNIRLYKEAVKILILGLEKSQYQVWWIDNMFFNQEKYWKLIMDCLDKLSNN